MFPADRGQLRACYAQAFHKWQTKAPLEPLEALVGEVVAEHPQYHRLVKVAGKARKEEGTFEFARGEPNPFLHLSMHVALCEGQSCARHNAEHSMMECLSEIMWSAQTNHRPPDEAAFLRCLRR
ncbi:MAG: DUF1841 family protein [Gammaproteobacteria bacterium]|nr:DUF1841 family protein [Gammaproteobacteria bacterium]